MSDKLASLQKEQARGEMRFQEHDEQFRQMRGKIVELEQKLVEAHQNNEKNIQKGQMSQVQMVERLKIYEEALRQVEAQVQVLTKGLMAIKEVKKKKLGNFGSAEVAYKKKDWKSAIVGYQKYRELNPQGRLYSTATLKIGICFQELGMASDARAFFDEVIEKFPKSKAAKTARNHLKFISNK